MKKISVLIMSAAILVLNSCKKDEPKDPVVPHEEELITSLTLTFVNQSNSSDIKVFSWYDADGDSGLDPVINAESLDANTIYNVSVELLNTTENPAENITEEVAEEAEEHQFFYVASQNSGVTAQYDDQDVNGNPIGINTVFTTTNVSADGSLIVTLKHEPTKGPNVGIEDAASAGGESDIQVTFELDVVSIP